MILLTGEVAFPLHRAIVLAFGLIQNDTHPFPRGKESGADIGDSAPLAFPYHLHYSANLVRKRGCRSLYNGFILMLLFLVPMEKNRHTFGAFPLSTVPALLILLISGLVSWMIWGKDAKKYDKDIHNHSLKVLKIVFLPIMLFFAFFFPQLE